LEERKNLIEHAENGKNNTLISLRKMESEFMGLTYGSKYYPRKVIDKEGNANSVLLKKQENP
jgi:hypothetical protein